MIYRIVSTKIYQEDASSTLAEVIAKADAVNAEYQPAFGVQVEDENGYTVYDTEDD